MPLTRCSLKNGGQGWKWGESGTCYPSKKQAQRQAAAAYANGYVKKGLGNPVSKFDKNQPRAPQGSSNGGQWVGSGASFNKETKQWQGQDGKPLPEATQARLKDLKIPPGWKQVELNSDPNAALQATGLDSKGRKQYRYSAAHTEAQAIAKFERVKAYASEAPRVKATLERQLGDPSVVGRQRDLAALTYLISQTGMRVGSKRETGAKVKAYGASTLLAKHAKVKGDTVSFSYTGKKGVARKVNIKNPEIAKFISEKRDKLKPNDPLFSVSGSAVSGVLRQITGNDKFKTHDMRTHVGTALAASLLSKQGKPRNKKSHKAKIKAISERVAKTLGNSPSEALKSYIDPFVFSPWEKTA